MRWYAGIAEDGVLLGLLEVEADGFTRIELSWLKELVDRAGLTMEVNAA